MFTGRLKDAATGDRVGSDVGQCTVIKVRRPRGKAICTVALFLPDGTITVAGGVRFKRSADFSLPVVGGTDAYAGAGGELTLDEQRGPLSRITITLVP